MILDDNKLDWDVSTSNIIERGGDDNLLGK